MKASPNLRSYVKDPGDRLSHDVKMANKLKKSANHLRAWRLFREMTQDELAAALDPPTAANVISNLETGDRGLSDKWLRKLAAALGTTPGFLLDFDPNDVDREYLEAVLSVPKESRAQALAILRTFRTGTNG